MKSPLKLRKVWPPIRIRRKGERVYYEVDCRGHSWEGKQQPTFTTYAEAEKEAQRVAKLVLEHGSAGGGEYHEDLHLVKVLRLRLAPFDIKLEDAVTIFINTKAAEIAAQKSATLGKVVDEWVDSKRDPNIELAEDTIEQCEDIRKRLIEGFTRECPLATITKQNVEDDLRNRKMEQSGRKIYLRMYRSFFKFAIEQKYLKNNPTDGIKITVKKAPTIIFSKDSILTMLGRVLEDQALVPFVTLGLFTGLRPFGLKRISWDDIHTDDRKYMYVSEEVSKTVEHHTPLHDNLIEWIKPHIGKPIVIVNHRKRLKKILAGLEKQDDIFRHTAISYFMGEGDKNIFRVSEHFGNSPQQIKKHYQRPVTDTDTAWFWSLTPEKVKQLIKERDKKKKAMEELKQS